MELREACPARRWLCRRRLIPGLGRQPDHFGRVSDCGILTGMTATTIKVPKRTRDRLHRLAAAEGLTLAQAIDKLIDKAALRPRPSVGGFSSGQPLDAEAIDAALADGFGA
jgi:hypothetical protein